MLSSLLVSSSSFFSWRIKTVYVISETLSIVFFSLVYMFKSFNRPLQEQRRINRKGHRNEVNESMDSYQLAIDYMEIRPNR